MLNLDPIVSTTGNEHTASTQSFSNFFFVHLLGHDHWLVVGDFKLLRRWGSGETRTEILPIAEKVITGRYENETRSALNCYLWSPLKEP